MSHQTPTHAILRPLVQAAAAAFICTAAPGVLAQTALGLGAYQLSASRTLDTLGGLGLEASAVTYARDRGTLFFVGDEGLGVVEITTGGRTLGSMRFDWAGTGSSNNDAEGLSYLGNGQLVVVDEPPQRAYSFNYSAGGTVALASTPHATISNYSPSNIGIEGISVDPRDGSFVSVKQDADGNPARGPEEVRGGMLSFAAGGGSSTMQPLFDPALLGLGSLSDIQTLSPVDRLAGTAAADNLLILSLGSRRLVEATRSGQVLGSFDLSGLTTQAIEGVTVDELGNIYLVAESVGALPSQLFVLSAVPEPASWALMAGGFVLLAWRARQRA